MTISDKLWENISHYKQCSLTFVLISNFPDSKSCKYYYGVEFEDGIQLGSFDCDKEILESWKRVNEFSEEKSWKYSLHRFIQKIDPFN